MSCNKCYLYNGVNIRAEFSEGIGRLKCAYDNEKNQILDTTILSSLKEFYNGVYAGTDIISEDINCIDYYCCENCPFDSTPTAMVTISEAWADTSDPEYGFFNSDLALKGADGTPLASGEKVRLKFTYQGKNIDVIFNEGDDITTATPLQDTNGNWSDISGYFNSGLVEDGGNLLFNKKQYAEDNNLTDADAKEIQLSVVSIENGVYSTNPDNSDNYVTAKYLYGYVSVHGRTVGNKTSIVTNKYSPIDSYYNRKNAIVDDNSVEFYYSSDANTVGMNGNENASNWVEIPYLTMNTLPASTRIDTNINGNKVQTYERADTSLGDVGLAVTYGRTTGSTNYLNSQFHFGIGETVQLIGDDLSVNVLYAKNGTFTPLSADSITYELISGGVVESPSFPRASKSEPLIITGENVLDSFTAPNSDYFTGFKNYSNMFDMSNYNYGEFGLKMNLDITNGYLNEDLMRFKIIKW